MKDLLAIFTRRLCDGACDDTNFSVIFFVLQSLEQLVFGHDKYGASLSYFQNFIGKSSSIVLWSMNAAALGCQHCPEPLSFDNALYRQSDIRIKKSTSQCALCRAR
jgi:hypothetical protein